MINSAHLVRCGGGEVEGVEVACGGRAEPAGRVLLLPLQGGRGFRCGVAGQDLSSSSVAVR